MSAVPPKPPKRRITPIALTAAAPAAAAPAAPTLTAAPAPAPATTTTTTTTTNVPLETLDRYIQQSLQVLRDDVDGLITNSFVPDKRTLDELEAGVKRVRGCVDRYHAAAEAAERAAAAERERLTVELQPVKIQRTAATTQIYVDNRKVLACEKRYLYKCPFADAMGICKPPNARRPFRPAARNNVKEHIRAWHLPRDKLREHRLSDAFWSEGADEQRAKARRSA